MGLGMDAEIVHGDEIVRLVLKWLEAQDEQAFYAALDKHLSGQKE